MSLSVAHQLLGLVSLSFPVPQLFLSLLPFFFFNFVLKIQILSYLLHIPYEFSVAAVKNSHKLSHSPGGWKSEIRITW